MVSAGKLEADRGEKVRRRAYDDRVRGARGRELARRGVGEMHESPRNEGGDRQKKGGDDEVSGEANEGQAARA
jgi:hypothetical protein